MIFLQIDNTFLAMYHANYGLYPSDKPEEAEKPQESTAETETKEKVDVSDIVFL